MMISISRKKLEPSNEAEDKVLAEFEKEFLAALKLRQKALDPKKFKSTKKKAPKSTT
jgi:hypothetical protein